MIGRKRGPKGAIPNLIGLGAGKCGTTTLAAQLRLHPEVFVPDQKEMHFFDLEEMEEANFEAYRLNFEPAKYVGDFTPNYMFDLECRDRMHQWLGPDVKFIVSLRDPADRAFSHYCHARNKWHRPRFQAMGYPIEDMPFDQALEAEEERISQSKYLRRRFCYFHMGLYAEQLLYYFEVFPRERFHIILLEDYMTHPAETLRSMCEFLEVDPDFTFAQPDLRLNAQTRSRSIEPEVRARLVERFLPSIERLEQILDRDLSAWKNAQPTAEHASS